MTNHTSETNPALSFVTLLAYDYKYAFEAIKSYYTIAEQIILGLDSRRLTWSGNPFEIDMSEVYSFVETIDRQKKILIVEDNFCKYPSAKMNDTAERNQLSMHCKPGNWIVQIDSDEILQNPLEFREWLSRVSDDVLIKASWINVFKVFQSEGMCLVVDGATGGPSVATKRTNSYISFRKTNQRALQSPLKLLHFSWGRTYQELEQKLNNWSHKDDFDINKYLKFWDSVTLSNFDKFTNFHPLDSKAWPKLKTLPMSAFLNNLSNFRLAP